MTSLFHDHESLFRAKSLYCDWTSKWNWAVQLIAATPSWDTGTSATVADNEPVS